MSYADVLHKMADTLGMRHLHEEIDAAENEHSGHVHDSDTGGSVFSELKAGKEETTPNA